LSRPGKYKPAISTPTDIYLGRELIDLTNSLSLFFFSFSRLSTIRDNLREQGRQLQQKVQKNAILLQKFQTAGKDFHMIVEAYADVMERIKVVQDDIRRLK